MGKLRHNSLGVRAGDKLVVGFPWSHLYLSTVTRVTCARTGGSCMGADSCWVHPCEPPMGAQHLAGSGPALQDAFLGGSSTLTLAWQCFATKATWLTRWKGQGHLCGVALLPPQQCWSIPKDPSGTHSRSPRPCVPASHGQWCRVAWDRLGVTSQGCTSHHMG